MVKNLSCVSCAAWNVFSINSLVGGVCCVYFRWLLVMAHVYCMIIKKWSIFMGGIFDNIIAAMFIHMYLHQWSVVSKKVSSFFDVVIFDRYAKVWQHDCDQHVNFCYLNYLLTQVHNRNFLSLPSACLRSEASKNRETCCCCCSHLRVLLVPIFRFF